MVSFDSQRFRSWTCACSNRVHRRGSRAVVTPVAAKASAAIADLTIVIALNLVLAGITGVAIVNYGELAVSSLKASIRSKHTIERLLDFTIVNLAISTSHTEQS
jgi:hypothetical protein